MILRQNTSVKLKRLLFQHKSILVPPKVTVRVGKTAHCKALNGPSQIARRINEYNYNHITPIFGWFSGKTRR